MCRTRWVLRRRGGVRREGKKDKIEKGEKKKRKNNIFVIIYLSHPTIPIYFSCGTSQVSHASLCLIINCNKKHEDLNCIFYYWFINFSWISLSKVFLSQSSLLCIYFYFVHFTIQVIFYFHIFYILIFFLVSIV